MNKTLYFNHSGGDMIMLILYCFYYQRHKTMCYCFNFMEKIMKNYQNFDR